MLLASTAHAAVISDTHFNTLTDSGTSCGGFPEYPSNYPVIASVPSSPDPSNALKISFPTGFVGGWQTAYCSGPHYDSDEIYMQVYVYFPTGYQFHTVGNKIAYSYINPASGGYHGNYIFGIFGSDRQVVIQTQPSSTSKLYGALNKVYYNNRTYTRIDTGQWYKLSHYFKLNTSGVSNGIIRIWVNDVLAAEYTDVNMRGGDEGSDNWYATSLQPIWGGMYQTKTVGDYFYMDRWITSTTALGGGGDLTAPYVDTFSPGDGATGVAQGTTSASFHVKDGGDGVNITTLDVGGLGCASCGSCDVGLTCSGTSADYTITRTPLSLSYDQVWSENINVSDLSAASNAMAQVAYNFTVEPDPGPVALEVTTTTLSDGTVGTNTPQTLASTGGVTPHTWSVVAGSLPGGRSLSPGGELTGEYTTTGTVEFTVQVTDSDTPPNTDNQVLTQYVAPAEPTGQTTVTITAIEDTYIWPAGGSNGDNNVSGSTQIEVYQWPAYTWANRILDNISLAALPANISITAASLEMYLTGNEGSGGTNPMRIHAYRVTDNVPVISTVTGNNFTGTLQPAESYTDVSTTPGWFAFNVLTMTQAAYAAGTPLYLALDGGSDGASDTNRIFASMDHATTAWRPRLKVTYTQLSGPPPAPSIMSPGKMKIRGGTKGRWRTFH